MVGLPWNICALFLKIYFSVEKMNGIFFTLLNKHPQYGTIKQPFFHLCVGIFCAFLFTHFCVYIWPGFNLSYPIYSAFSVVCLLLYGDKRVVRWYNVPVGMEVQVQSVMSRFHTLCFPSHFAIYHLYPFSIKGTKYIYVHSCLYVLWYIIPALYNLI